MAQHYHSIPGAVQCPVDQGLDDSTLQNYHRSRPVPCCPGTEWIKIKAPWLAPVKDAMQSSTHVTMS